MGIFTILQNDYSTKYSKKGRERQKWIWDGLEIPCVDLDSMYTRIFFLKSSSWTLNFMHFIICKLYHNKIMIKISELVNK